jgi:hypothetical protein
MDINPFVPRNVSVASYLGMKATGHDAPVELLPQHDASNSTPIAWQPASTKTSPNQALCALKKTCKGNSPSNQKCINNACRSCCLDIAADPLSPPCRVSDHRLPSTTINTPQLASLQMPQARRYSHQLGPIMVESLVNRPAASRSQVSPPSIGQLHKKQRSQIIVALYLPHTVSFNTLY